MTTEAARQPQPPVEIAIEPVADTAGPEAHAAAEQVVQDAIEQETGAERGGRQPLRSNVNRTEIGDRFARSRREREDQIPFNGSHADPAVLAGKLIQEQPDEPPDEGTGIIEKDTTEARASGPSDSQAPADAPRKFKVKVRHEEKELTQDELIAAAQKTLAGDDYLGEARTILEEVKRVASSSPHQGRADPAKPERTDQPEAPPHQEDDDRALAEKIQFGSPDEAAEAIAKLKRPGMSEEDVQRAVYGAQRQSDIVRATTAYETFKKDNADLVNDPIAHAAMEKTFYGGLREDLKKLGYPEDRIPQDTTQLVEAHRFHRVQGQAVRDTAALLEASKKAVLNWKGGSQQQQRPAAEPGKITVSVDRTERRQAIPQQPARAAVPPQATTSAKPVQSARSEAVRDMLGKRRRLVIT